MKLFYYSTSFFLILTIFIYNTVILLHKTNINDDIIISNSVAGMYRLFISVILMLPFVHWKSLRFMEMRKEDWSIKGSINRRWIVFIRNASGFGIYAGRTKGES
ncbi:hypothetical protein BS614_20145 [Paenibacillus xylanexedens]|nr:hypothetical protein BS614_20145 [Paenibacillus xylanexedens]